LRKNGAGIKLQEQQILVLLLECPGEIVDREQIRARLWPDNTFVDFDNAISSAIRKLREGLGDNADNLRFIETVAKRGYRFIGSIAAAPPPTTKPPHVTAAAIVAGTLLTVGTHSLVALAKCQAGFCTIDTSAADGSFGMGEGSDVLARW
jgi:DNA-binding winged helix-turn-helix (wHTH) protein